MTLIRGFLIVGMLAVVLAVAVLASSQAPTVRGSKAALFIIDVQHCFMPGVGSLPVAKGDEVISKINKIREDFEEKFSLVVVSQDWHCPDHVSFASQHPGHNIYDVVNLTYNARGELCYGDSVPADFAHAVDCSAETDSSNQKVVEQTLWPDHCVLNATSGALDPGFSPTLTVKDTDVIIKKGYTCGVDSYSAFFDNGGFRQTELHGILQKNNIEVAVITGLALDFCVYFTSKDAKKLGYKVLTVEDASRGVAPESTKAAVEDMKKSGIEIILADDLEGALQDTSRAYQPGTLSAFLLVVVGALVTAYLLFKS